ncbi:MAG TPA: HAMP domain-containing histidine kinase [Candidatus Bacteroides merdigallinarum]|uniref:histidine kinase n=1 Tax=Candidatus Bacteroides merdigallinarum TaxID=2838473 RepID=A0A9D2E888_9BACE|nr:HAMP domain-containing histidine kinase [Candidatus Bacteroides merdigallinarum]
MKLPSKYIALVVILSLAAIFAYQAYWLVNLYHTQCREVERDITEAMRLSDYNELILRIERLKADSVRHGEVTVSAGYNDNNPYVQSRTIVTEQRGDSTFINLRQREVKDTAAISPSLHTNDSTDFLFRRKNTIQDLANYFQRGLHAGLDVLHEPDFATYDSLLCDELRRAGLNVPYRLMQLCENDTLNIHSTAGYLPSPDANVYEYAYDLHGSLFYRLTIEPIHGLVLRQMAGILATSAIILLVLGFSFWYLIRILLRQRTLEEMKDDFTNNVTHELKTPIAVAYAANDALLNFGADTDEVKRTRYLRICQEQLKRLGGLVEQILSLSMERRKTFRLQRTTFPVSEVIAPLIEEHKLKADKPVNISTRITPSDLMINADRTHFANIVSNLLDNAIKYSIGQAAVEIEARKEGETFIFSVQDKGIGIPKDKLPRVFDKFYRVPTGNLHDVKGYGLGLYYVKTMVEQHGGTVEVESEPGRGSEFIIKLRMKNEE